jgi:hypothetical protein
MTVGLSATTANGIVDGIGSGTIYVKLHTADPGASGATAASANTTRVQSTRASASAGSSAQSGTAPSWASWASGSETISHISLWTASTAGTFLGSAALTASKAVANGDTLTLSTLTIALTPIAA